ncbi:MAG: DUF998 domain-containing protein [Dehalococcoidia bacterium]|nr:DUF998 domain-containing protein [Dehalococcoidia bacterium]
MTRVGSRPKPVLRLAFQRVSAACGIVTPVLAALVGMGVGYIQLGYSFTEQRLSELGASGAPYALIFNVVGLITSGMLVVVFSLGLYSEFNSNRVARIGAGLLTVCGASLLMAGIFPCDIGTVEASASGILHGVFAGIGTFAIISAALAMWLGLKYDAVWRKHSWFSLSIAVVAVALYVPHLFSSLPRWNGAVQRMLVMVLLVWIEIMSIKLLSRSWAGGPIEST